MDSSVGFDPFTVGGGVLDILATPNNVATTPCGANPPFSYYAGSITTEGMFAQIHGYFEMRAQLPPGAGMWPAFYMVPNTYEWPPELDVLEAFGAPAPSGGGGGSNQVHIAIHDAVASAQMGSWETVPADIYTGYHAYGADWEASTITYYFDGLPIGQFPTPTDFTLPMYLIVDLAVGGTWPELCDGRDRRHAGQTTCAPSPATRASPAVAFQPLSSPDGSGLNLYGATAAQ